MPVYERDIWIKQSSQKTGGGVEWEGGGDRGGGGGWGVDVKFSVHDTKICWVPQAFDFSLSLSLSLSLTFCENGAETEERKKEVGWGRNG